jgi:phosphoribosylformimino-5-aminoimidazole carboxamide ribotide isomerase
MADRFTIIPAIDLRRGKVVRLAQGDPQRLTSYGDNPLHWAERWKAEGAGWLHIINLDGAFGENTTLNLQVLESILSLGMNIEFGGGIRDRASIETILALGVKRVFLGTAAIQNPELVDWAVATYGPACIAGDIGALEGKVVIKGWQESTALTVLEAGQLFHSQGMERCVVTDVERDGAGTGVNITSAVELQKITGLQVVASGGVNSFNDVARVQEAGLAGVIIGRALYEGRMTFAECRMAFTG